jgi:CRISPR/Cas system-associated protein Csm6
MGMRRVFIAATVGTSLLGNAARQIQELQGAGSAPPGSEADARLARLAEDPAFVERLIQFAESNPEAASAELNTLAKFFRRYADALNGAEFEVKYYATDTGAGRLALEALRRVDHLKVLAAGGGGPGPRPWTAKSCLDSA